jgi:DNA-directed RNA polymerase specialized sigma24 family protein
VTDLVAALDANAGALLDYLERRIGIDDAPDALAEVMTVVWRREADLPTDATEARMWMFGIAKGVVANVARGKVRRAKLADRLRAVTAVSGGVGSGRGALGGSASAASAPSAALAFSALPAAALPTAAPPADHGLEVRDAIARLDRELAEIVRLVHWDGFTLGEVAALEGIPASTVRSRYAHAKRELAAALGAQERDAIAERVK